jgi:hypothetical protein
VTLVHDSFASLLIRYLPIRICSAPVPSSSPALAFCVCAGSPAGAVPSCISTQRVMPFTYCHHQLRMQVSVVAVTHTQHVGMHDEMRHMHVMCAVVLLHVVYAVRCAVPSTED